MKKRITSLVLCIAVLLLTIPVAKAAPSMDFDTKYTNTVCAESAVVISNTGKLTASFGYSGYRNRTTRGEITTYIEKKVLFFFWSRVNIGQTGNEWFNVSYNYYYAGHRTFQLQSTGTYRVTITYKIYGTGSPDVITHVLTKTY